MTTEKQMCSFVDLMNDLRCKYDDLLDRNVYLLSELNQATQHWYTGWYV
jgi:hypothetical protein